METSSSVKQREKKQILKLNLQTNATETHSVLMARGEHWLMHSTHIRDMVGTSITFHNCSILFLHMISNRQIFVKGFQNNKKKTYMILLNIYLF